MRRVALVVLFFGVLFGACGGDEQVGSKENLEFEEQEAGRLGEGGPTTTEAPRATTTTAAAPRVIAAPTTTAAPRPTSPPTTAASAPAFTVKIISGGQGFDPFSFAVRKGTRISVQNTDSQPRTFTSDDPGVFDSGMIPPGGTFAYTADRIGKFNFHDETRPFAVGQMEVQ